MEMRNDKISEKFKTSDSWLAATMLALGEQILAVEKNDPRRFVFVFQKTSGLREKIENFKLGNLRIEPKQLLIHQRGLKHLIHSEY